MHKKNIINVTKQELIPLAQKFLSEKRRLVIMNGYIDKEGKYSIAYNFDIDGSLVTYLCKSSEPAFPSLTPVYKNAAEWCEEEICEMMPVKFEGLPKSKRLFLPDDFDGSGQILVLPMDELKKCRDNHDESCKLSK